MKNNISKLTILFITFVLLNSCASINKKDIHDGIYNGRLGTIDKITNFYLKLLSNNYMDRSQKDLMVILSQHVDSAQMVESNTKVFNDSLNIKMKQFALLKSVYIQIDLMEKSSDKELRNAEDSLAAAYKAIQALKDVPAKIKASIDSLKPMIEKAVGGRKLEYHKDVVYKLTSIYSDIWDNEQITVEFIKNKFNDFEAKIKNLPVAIFDAEKLKEMINQPYSDKSILVDMYKIKMVEKINESQAALNDEIAAIDKSMELLIKIDKELAKNQFINGDLAKFVQELTTVQQTSHIKN